MYCHLLAAYTALVSGEIDNLIILVLIFIPAWSYAAAHRSSSYWRPCSEDTSSTKSSAKQMFGSPASNNSTLVNLVVTVNPIGYEEDWWQHTTLSKFNTHSEQLWVNAAENCDKLLSRNTMSWLLVTSGQYRSVRFLCRDAGGFSRTSLPVIGIEFMSRSCITIAFYTFLPFRMWAFASQSAVETA